MKKKLSIILLASSIAFSVVGSASWIIAKSIIESTNISKNDISEVEYFKLTKYSADKSTSTVIDMDKDDYLSKYLGADPFLDGYYFDGWFDYNTQAPIDENQIISSNISIYPVYTEIASSNSTSNIDNGNITPGTSTDQNVVNITDGSLGSGNSLDVPYDSTKDPCNTNNTTTGSTTSFGSEDDAVTKIVLQNDLIIESGATFNLGAQVGYSSGSGPNVINGAISGGFTTLDLNGHNIIVYGTFKAYGLVTNSRIGKGLVYVASGGKVVTPFCILDFGGGGNLCNTYNFSYAPFTLYSTPYMSCTTIIEAGGSFDGVASLNASSDNYPTDMYFIGPSDSYLLTLNSGYAIDESSNYNLIANNMSKFIPSLYREGLIFTNKLDLNKYKLPESITYNSSWENSKADIVMNSLTLTIKMVISVTADMSYVEFPISSFLDIKFYGCNITLKQAVEVYPYATIYLDNDSILIFSDNNNIQYVQGGIGTRDFYSTTLQYPGTQVFINSYILNDLKSKSHPGLVTIDGNLSFNENTSTDVAEKYKIGGYINLSNIALDSLKKAIKDGVGINVLEASQHLGTTSREGKINSRTSTTAYLKVITKYYCYPLISNNVAYFIHNSVLKTGLYDMTTGLITIDNITYSFIFSNNEYLCPGTLTKNDIIGGVLSNPIKPQNNIRNRIVNCIGTWNECTYNSSNGIITIESNYYVFYNGAYIRVNSNSSSTTFYYSTKSSIKIYSGSIFSSPTTEYYQNWKFNQHGFTTLESESLNFNSTTKQWTHS